MGPMTSDPADDPNRGLPRIGDAERQSAVEALSEHYVAGRLDEAEFNQRMDVAMQARTTADLGPLFSDLPPLDAYGPAPRHQQLAPLPPSYTPATTSPPAATPATTGKRSRTQTLQLVRTLVWPVAIGLWLILGVDFFVLLVAAIVTSVVVGKLLEDEKKKSAPEIPLEWQTPPDPDDMLPPGPPPRP